MIIAADHEWDRNGHIDILGLAWDQGKSMTAVDRTPYTLQQHLDIMRRADLVVMQNGLDADVMALQREGVDVSWLIPKVYDTRLAFFAINNHLAGTGSFDLRSIALLAGERNGYRWGLEHKQYESDIHRTCSMDAACCAWLYPTLDRQIRNLKLEPTLDILHRCQPIFSLMHAQGIRLDKRVLEQIHAARQQKATDIVERYHLWETRGKRVVKRVPIWRSDKILDKFQELFGVRPKSRQRKVWEKLSTDSMLSPEGREFAAAVLDLGKAANDATFVGKAEEQEDGSLDFSKVNADGFIFPRYDLCGSPDRAIASGPNIAQWPRPKDDPREVKLRSAVLPLQDDHVILGVDLGSVETYTTAIEMDDWDRVRAIQEGRVSHQGTADMINQTFGLSLDRNQGKVLNHAADKCESPFNTATRLFKTDRPSRQQVLQCRNIFMRMLQDYPKTAQFRDSLWEKARSNPLVVTNLFGRRLMCFSRSRYGDANERFAKHDPAKAYWCSCSECAPRRERFKFAVAFIGRSSAFDALLRIMARIFYEKRLDDYSLPVLEAHDELDFSIPIEKAQYYAQRALEAFQEPVPELGGISLPAEAKVGANWSEAH